MLDGHVIVVRPGRPVKEIKLVRLSPYARVIDITGIEWV